MPVEKEDDFMSSLLSNMDATKSVATKPKPRQSRPAPRKRKSSPVLGTSSEGESYDLAPPSRQNGASKIRRPAPLQDAEDELRSSPPRAPKRLKVDPELEGKVSSLKVEDDYDMADFNDAEYAAAMDDMDLNVEVNVKPVMKPDPAATPVKIKKDEGTPAWLTLHSNLLAAPVDSEELETAANVSSTSANVDALQADGSLYLYWLDYAELQGKLYLMGKVLDKATKKFVSCCLSIDGLERNLFVAPRDRTFGRCLIILRSKLLPAQFLNQSFSISPRALHR